MEACASLVGKSLESSSLGVSRNICAYNESHFFFKFFTVDVACCLMLRRSQVPCLILNCVGFLFFCSFFVCLFFCFLPPAADRQLMAFHFPLQHGSCVQKKVSLERFPLQGKGVNKQIQCNIGVRGGLDAC